MREKAQVLDEFWIKIIAYVTMTLDHIGMYLRSYYISSDLGYQVGTVFRMFGRIAFPLFVLMLAEGLHYSKNRGKYISRIAIMWGIMLCADIILFTANKIDPSSVIGSMGSSISGQAFTDLLCLGLIIYLFEHPKKWARPLCVIPLLYLVFSYIAGILKKNGVDVGSFFPAFLWADYSIFGLFILLGFYYSYKIVDTVVIKYLVPTGTQLEEYKKTKSYRGLVNVVGTSIFLAVSLIFWGISYINDTQFDPFELASFRIQNYCLLACVPLLMYNGKRGYDSKAGRIIEYIYYPVHFAIIALTFGLIF